MGGGRGRFAEDEHRLTFIEEGNWIRVAVGKDALRGNNYNRARDTELEAKLYLSVRLEQERRSQQKKHLQAAKLPKTTRDLEVKKEEDAGHLYYADKRLRGARHAEESSTET